MNGGTEDQLGLELEDVQFGLALMSEKAAAGSTTPARSWTSMQAEVGSASFVGVDGLTVAVTSLGINVNQTSVVDGAVVRPPWGNRVSGGYASGAAQAAGSPGAWPGVRQAG